MEENNNIQTDQKEQAKPKQERKTRERSRRKGISKLKIRIRHK